MKHGVREECGGVWEVGVEGEGVFEGLEALGEGEDEMGDDEMVVLVESEEEKARVDLLEMGNGRGEMQEIVECVLEGAVWLPAIHFPSFPDFDEDAFGCLREI